MIAPERATLRIEISRQRRRLEADLAPRLIAAALSMVCFGFFLPFWAIFLSYLTIVGTEIFQSRLLRAYETSPSPGLYTAWLFNAALCFAAFSTPALFVWLDAEPLVKFVAVLALTGALINISVVRATHFVFGVFSGLPPAMALLWIPSQYLFDPVVSTGAWVASAASLTVIGYFLSALVQNNRSQSALATSVDAVSEANAAKSRFLAAMGAEVRAPLGAIQDYGSRLGDVSDPAARREYVASIKNAARNLQMLLEDVFDLSSVTEGALRFSPVTVVIRNELDVLRAMNLSQNSHGAPEMAIEVAEEIPELARLDPILLRKCLGHLSMMVLAEQPSDRRAAIDIRCALAPGQTDRLRLTITGRGAAYASKSDGPAQPEDPLALTLVHHIAEIIGARAAVLRAPDGNLIARIELPFVAVADPPATGAEMVYGKLRALVVDDIATNRRILTQMLRTLRIESDEVASGGDALHRLAGSEFDFVLLDMNMPDMDGEATFREIRGSEEGWANIPVVAVTSDTVARKRDYYMSVGLNGFVSKPVDPRLLWAEILTVVPPPPPL